MKFKHDHGLRSHVRVAFITNLVSNLSDQLAAGILLIVEFCEWDAPKNYDHDPGSGGEDFFYDFSFWYTQWTWILTAHLISHLRHCDWVLKEPTQVNTSQRTFYNVRRRSNIRSLHRNKSLSNPRGMWIIRTFRFWGGSSSQWLEALLRIVVRVLRGQPSTHRSIGFRWTGSRGPLLPFRDAKMRRVLFCRDCRNAKRNWRIRLWQEGTRQSRVWCESTMHTLNA